MSVIVARHEVPAGKFDVSALSATYKIRYSGKSPYFEVKIYETVDGVKTPAWIHDEVSFPILMAIYNRYFHHSEDIYTGLVYGEDGGSHHLSAPLKRTSAKGEYTTCAIPRDSDANYYGDFPENYHVIILLNNVFLLCEEE